VLELLIRKEDKLITEDPDFLADAIEAILATVFTYSNTRRDLVTRPLHLCLNTVYEVLHNPAKFGGASKLIDLQIFKVIAKEIREQDKDAPERIFCLQEMLLQVTSLGKKIGRATITMTEQIFKVKKLEQIMKEGQSLDLLTFEAFLQDIPEEQRQMMQKNFRTNQKMFKAPFKARLRVEGVDVMLLEFKTKGLEPFAQMRVSTDKEGTNVINTIDNSSPANVELFSNEVFLQYPFKSSVLIGTGDEEYGTFGRPGSSNVYNVEVKHDIIREPIKDIRVQRWYTVMLTERGNLYHTGRMRGYDTQTEFKLMDLPDKVRAWAVGKYHITVQLDNLDFYAMGRNKVNNLGGNPESAVFKKLAVGPALEGQEVRLMAAGVHATMFYTKDKRLFIMGNKMQDYLELP